MPIQNGERLVTKQDLADMYQGILPYLGGMPEMLANKFSKGDLYSTDEKMIGQWKNGKPLYQITCTGTFSDTVGLMTNVVTDIENVEEICDIQGGAYYTMGSPAVDYMQPLPFTDNAISKVTKIWAGINTSSVLIINGYNNNTACLSSPWVVTIKYTKTTDTAISIGSDTDYSTEEKIVGTWIDGKPLYQKTFEITTADTISEWSRVNIDTAVDFIQLKDACMYNGAGSYITLNGFNGAFTSGISVTLTNNNHVTYPNTIAIITTESSWLSKTCYITIQYTKTTGT